MKQKPILLVEDTRSLRLVYEAILRGAGHRVVAVETAEEGFAALEIHKPDLVVLDLSLPDRDGLVLMKDCLQRQPKTCFVAITAHGSVNRAVGAMRAGAYEFLVKPFDENRLLSVVSNALLDVARRADQPHRQTASDAFPGCIGESKAIRDVFARLFSASRSMASVFLTGESGTGKELFARALHNASTRADNPFVPINCGAIPSERLESEVFGHLKGSFAGAVQDKPGAAALADGGTLFLDDICEMDTRLQIKLLRFLETSTIQPLGSASARKVDARIICATSRDPLEEIRVGRFREDLYYLLHVLPIHLPPLRARDGDAVLIAEDALARIAAEENRRCKKLSPEVKAHFNTYRWPGNIRQLLNVIRSSVVMHDCEELDLEMLPAELTSDPAINAFPAPEPVPQQIADAPVPMVPPLAVDTLLGKTLAEIERLVIEETIRLNGNSVPRAARMLDVSPSTLYRKREAWARQIISLDTNRRA